MFIITILCLWFMLVGSHLGSNHLHRDLCCSTMDGSLLLSPRVTRARTKPNLSVSEVQYKEALHALLVADPPMLDLKAKLGPELAQHLKQVTPGHLVSLEKLWYQLISSGCKQLVLQSQKIRSALHARCKCAHLCFGLRIEAQDGWLAFPRSGSHHCLDAALRWCDE